MCGHLGGGAECLCGLGELLLLSEGVGRGTDAHEVVDRLGGRRRRRLHLSRELRGGRTVESVVRVRG